MPFFRKRPVVVVEARQFDGANAAELQQWCSEKMAEFYDHPRSGYGVLTLEGWRPLPVGYWIVKGVEGEFYPVEPGIFTKTYERVVRAYTDAQWVSATDEERKE